MEAKEENNITSGVSVKVNEATDGFQTAPRTENPVPFPAPAVTSAAEVSPAPVSMAVPTLVTGPGTGTGTGTGTEGKKKRGRPRKYGPDGKLTTALSPMPISASIPLTGEYSAWKRGRGRPVDNTKKSYKYEHETPGKGIIF